MPPRKDEEAESRKRGSADVELDGGGARRKGARTEAAAAAATSAKTEENGGARAGRTKGLRVKLAGAGKCTRRGAEEESVADDPGAEESVANPTADAPAAETVGGGSGGGGGPAEVPAAKFQVGAVIILYNGSLRYEAEVLKVSLSEPKKSAPTAKGGRGRVASPGPSISYLVRYTKWPRRPEEWVGEAFAYQWDEPLAKIVTNRPPRKQMWVESKADKAKSAEADGGGEASAAGDAAGEEAKGKSGRASAKGEAAAEAGEQAPGGRGQRGRKPTEKGAERAASDAAAEMASMGTEPDEDEGGLAMLMKLGRKATPKRDEEDEEGEEGDEEEEGGEEEEGEEEDDDEEGSDESDNEQAEQANSNDDMSAGEDEDEDMIRIARERAAANDPQSMLMQMAEMTADVPKPKAEATHRRKGVPLKSIQRKAQNGQAGYQEHAKVHSKQMSMWQQQVREQTRMVDASSIVLSAEDGNSANSARGGAQRRRKQLYPAPSLLPLF